MNFEAFTCLKKAFANKRLNDSVVGSLVVAMYVTMVQFVSLVS